MDADVNIKCSSPRCHEVMSGSDDVYCSKCMDVKDDDIRALEDDVARLEAKVHDLEDKNSQLLGIIQGCEACSAHHAAQQL